MNDRTASRGGLCFFRPIVIRLFTGLLIAILMSGSAFAGWMTYNLGEPITKLKDNTAVDIIYGDGYIWLATTRGISGTSDGGQTWITYDASNDLNSSDISAVAFSHGALWVGVAHTEVLDGQVFQFGDGFNLTTDLGANWESFEPDQASSPQMLPFDIAIVDQSDWSFSAVYAACFAGGLIRTTDGGQLWQNIYASADDSIDFVDQIFKRRTNLYYSVVVDTIGEDTLTVWAGSAAGIHKYTYIDERIKLAGMKTFDIAFDGEAVWLAVDGGISRGVAKTDAITYQFWSWDEDDGLLSSTFTAVEADSTLVIAAAFDASLDESAGFNITYDSGESWIAVTPVQAVGPGKIVREIVKHGDAIFAACSRGGLIKSIDDGQTWESIIPIPGETSPDEPFNRFNSLHIRDLGGDSIDLWAGSDSGIFVFTMESDTSEPDQIRHIPFADSDTTGQRIEAIFVRDYLLGDETVEEQVWVATHPLDEDAGIYQVVRSTDYGLSWTRPLQPAKAYDFDVYVGLLWVSSEAGMLRTAGPGVESTEFSLIPFPTVDSAMQRIETTDVDMWVSSRDVSARTRNGVFWRLERVNEDPLKYDFHNLYDTLDNLAGDWVTALGIQYDDDRSIVWASTRKTEGGRDGVTFTRDDGKEWQQVPDTIRAWNFAFDDGDVYIAATEGLFKRPEDDPVLEKLEFLQTGNPRRRIAPNAEFFSVRVVDDVLWAGSNDGIVVDTIRGSTEILREFSNAELPYASPVPASPTRGLQFLRFHYELLESDYITIKVYDFAMNLVKTVVDNEFRLPREAADQDDDDSWDMRNGDGEIVAAGVYFFVIERSSGETEWGKLMVLP